MKKYPLRRTLSSLPFPRHLHNQLTLHSRCFMFRRNCIFSTVYASCFTQGLTSCHRPQHQKKRGIKNILRRSTRPKTVAFGGAQSTESCPPEGMGLGLELSFSTWQRVAPPPQRGGTKGKRDILRVEFGDEHPKGLYPTKMEFLSSYFRAAACQLTPCVWQASTSNLWQKGS